MLRRYGVPPAGSSRGLGRPRCPNSRAVAAARTREVAEDVREAQLVGLPGQIAFHAAAYVMQMLLQLHRTPVPDLSGQG